MSTALTILTKTYADLAHIVKDATTSIQGQQYTYQTNLGAQRHQGVTLKDTKLDTYPAVSLASIRAIARDAGHDLPNADLIIPFSIEAADKLAGRDWLTVAFAMLEDIRAAVNLTPTGKKTQRIRPGAAGQNLFDILPKVTGSDLVIVRRWYSIVLSELYPQSVD